MRISRQWISGVFLMLVAGVATGVSSAVGDGVSPRLSDLRITPDAGPRGTRYTIAVRISDPQGAGDIVALLYQLREQAELIRLDVNDEGRGADRVAGDGVYTGESVVPETASIGVHRFELFARDREGNRSNILRYRFTVKAAPRLIPL